jgi:SecD/SecF fusion protein
LASRRSHLTLVALLLAALVGVFFIGWSGSPVHKELRQGLDLQGGLEVVLQAQPPRGHKLTPEDMDISVNVTRNRIDSLGVSEPVVTQQGSHQIVIELPAVHDINRAAAIIGATAQLELFDLETSLVAPSIGASQNPVAASNLYGLLTSVQSGQKGLPAQYYLFNSRTKLPVAAPAQTLAQLKRDPAVKALKPLKASTAKKAAPLKTTKGFPTGYQLLTVPANRVVITCDAKTSVVCPGLNSNPAPGVTYYFLFKHDLDAPNPVPQMTGKDVKLKGTQQDFDPTTGQPIVTMHFTGHGNKMFHDITRQEAIRGQTLGTPQHFAIVLDNQIRSWPQIEYQKYPDGIDPSNGGAEITGMASLSEAKDIALVLRSGALRVPFITVERTDVSATLGKDSLRQARNAAIGGLIVVALFLLLLYRFLGLVAVIGLGIYAAFMYGAILLFGVTLTLPGFAGLILTMVVAADANVVVFERIK